MSRISKRKTSTKQRLKSQETKTSKTSQESPCGRKPAQIPVGSITVTVLSNDAKRHERYRLRVRWPEVTADIDGFPVTTIDRYIVHLQHSDDGVTWDPDFRRKVVDAKDGDDGVNAKAIFKGIRRKRYYRVRVRARDKKGCKSELSEWTTAVRPGSAESISGVGPIRRERVGPRRIEFDWDDTEHEDFDRYKVVVLKADTENGGFDVVRTRYVRHSTIAIHVADTDKTRWWKVRVRVQTTPSPDGTRDESGDVDSTADQADDTSGGPSAAPSTPTGVVTRRRLKAVLVRWEDVQDDATQEPVKYRVYAADSSISSTPGFNPALVTKGGHALITRYWSGSSWQDFTKADAGSTFYFRVQAKNAVGTSSLSSQVTGSPKKKISTQDQSDTYSTDDADVTDVIANRFIADDGSGDRIVISDTAGSKAQIKFIGGSGSTTLTVNSAGNVTATGGKFTFSGGVTLPYVGPGAAPATTNGSIFVASAGTYTNYLYWRANGVWKRPSGIGNG